MQTTEDAVYQGRVTLIQPAKGFRAGMDSLILAASLPRRGGSHALELGSGCGGALLPAAFRHSDMSFTGVEIDPAMAALVEQGVAANGWSTRIDIHTAEAGEWVKAHENAFDLVFANPPYFEPGRISAPGEGKESAYLEHLDLPSWIKAMVFAAKPRAPIVMIHRAAELARILQGFDKQMGEVTVLPIASKAGEPARRVLVRGRKGLKRGEIKLLAPLVLHASDGTPSEALRAVQNGEAIDW